MTPTDVTLVRESFAKVVPIRTEAAALFYADLFETAPQVKPYFADTDMKDQGNKLMETLAIIANGLDMPERILPAARALAVRHVGYGVQPADYACVGASLMRTLEKGLGEAFSPEIRAAWLNAYTVLSDEMIAAAYPEDQDKTEVAE